MLIIKHNAQQNLCVSSIWIAQRNVCQFNILRYKRHVFWENVPEQKLGVSYCWSLM